MAFYLAWVLEQSCYGLKGLLFEPPTIFSRRSLLKLVKIWL